MRIAIISAPVQPSQVPDPQGPAPQEGPSRMVELAQALITAGHHVRIYARGSANRNRAGIGNRNRAGIGNHAGASPPPPGVTVETVPLGSAQPRTEAALVAQTRRFGERLGRQWRDGGWAPDLVHAHYWLGGLAAVTASREIEVPVALTYHDLASARQRALGVDQTGPAGRVEWERELGNTVSLVITQSRAEMNELARLGVPRDQMVLVPTGVDPESFAPVGQLAPNHSGRRRIVVVGSAHRLEQRKGFVDLIRALRQVPDAELIILGGPDQDNLERDPYVRDLRAAAGACEVGDRVRFVGRVPRGQMPDWYRRADLVACASWYEPFGVAALEAMASGVPVVATAVGGLRDTVVDGVTGVLVPPRQPATLGRAIRGVLADPIRRMEYAAAGLDRARQCYAWDRVTSQLDAQYRQLADPRPSP